MENPSESCSAPNAMDGAFADPGISSPSWADRLIACLIDYNLASVCAITGTITSRPAASQHYGSTPHHAPKPLVLSNENDYHLHIWGLGKRTPVPRATATGGIMRTRQDIWLDWATGILVALGIVAIAAGSVLIAWMSLNPL